MVALGCTGGEGPPRGNGVKCASWRPITHPKKPLGHTADPTELTARTAQAALRPWMHTRAYLSLHGTMVAFDLSRPAWQEHLQRSLMEHK